MRGNIISKNGGIIGVSKQAVGQCWYPWRVMGRSSTVAKCNSWARAWRCFRTITKAKGARSTRPLVLLERVRVSAERHAVLGLERRHDGGSTYPRRLASRAPKAFTHDCRRIKRATAAPGEWRGCRQRFRPRVATSLSAGSAAPNYGPGRGCGPRAERVLTAAAPSPSRRRASEVAEAVGLCVRRDRRHLRRPQPTEGVRIRGQSCNWRAAPRASRSRARAVVNDGAQSICIFEPGTPNRSWTGGRP